MTKEPQSTTHNAERGACGTCRERLETGSSPKRTEQNICCSLIGEISWRFRVKCSGVWRKRLARCIGMFGGKVLGALEDPYSVIFGEKFCQ